jgi:hypothetical protein
MNSFLKKILYFLFFSIIFYFVGRSIYFYYFDKSIPVINCVGIEKDKSYSGVIDVILDLEDDYKLGNFSIFIDDSTMISKQSISGSSYNFKFQIPSLKLIDGKHVLKIIVVDASRNKNFRETLIPFFIDNKPLEIKLVKEAPFYSVFQGNTLHIILQSNKENVFGRIKTASGVFQIVNESQNSKILECFIPVSTDEIPNKYILTINIEDYVGNNALIEEAYQVVSQNFKKQNIKLNNKKFEEEPGKNQLECEEILKNSVLLSPKKKLWNGKFYAPCQIRGITTEFGVIRTSVEKGRYRHDAIDISSLPKGPVWATQDGIVILKDRFVSTGNTVAIDHGCGIISIYGHLDSYGNVEVGMPIRRGNIIGTIGMTGYATGYHLHWELRINNVQVNPMEWIQDDIRF